MKVSEFIEWLKTKTKDQDAIVKIKIAKLDEGGCHACSCYPEYELVELQEIQILFSSEGDSH